MTHTLRRFALPAATIAALALAPLSVHAKGRGFDTNIQSPVNQPVKIEVVLSDDLAYRANNLPEKLRDRGSSRIGLRNGFSANGYYGEDALQYLVDETYEELTEDFARRGIAQSDTAPLTLRVTLVDVKNNRPTHRQLSEQVSLDFQSFGIGGAELKGELIGAAGESLGTMEYRWFDTLNGDGFDRGRPIWGDARRAISRFANKASKTLS